MNTRTDTALLEKTPDPMRYHLNNSHLDALGRRNHFHPARSGCRL